MILPIVFRDEARREFDEAFDWYSRQRSVLGLVFEGAVQRTFELIAENPGSCAAVWGDIRRAVVRRFPYCIFYRPHPDRIEVLAVFHASRNPSEWQRRA